MRRRVDKLGVSEPEIRKQGNDQIVIELPGVNNQERAAELIGKTAKLELYDLQGDLVPAASADIQGFPIAAARRSPDLLCDAPGPGEEGDSARVLSRSHRQEQEGQERRTRSSSARWRRAKEILDSKYVKETRQEGRVPKGTEILAVPENKVVVTCGRPSATARASGAPSRTYYYLFKYDPRTQGASRSRR